MTREPVWLLDKLSASSFVAMVVTGACLSPLFDCLTTSYTTLVVALLNVLNFLVFDRLRTPVAVDQADIF